MELECDLSKINNEELLRKMWQQTEDASRKKEIRSQLYKLRESRLRDLYQGDIMADNSVAGFGKDPLATSHGDALADQSFQSLKSKEIRDSLSPTEMKFQSMALNNPNATGWDVQSSKEVSPDGKGFRAETVATTDGVESVNGGIAEFKGRNEQRSSAHHQGDDKNFVKKAMESSNSHLQEKVVIGDENSGRTEVRTSSSKSTSSSQVFQSSSNVEYDDDIPRHPSQPERYLMDANRPQDLQQRQQQEQQRLLEEQRIYEQQFQQQHQQYLNQQERRTSEQLSTIRQNTEQKNISQNIQTQETHEQNKRYVDMDKASPEYQQQVQHLMQQPGEIISNTVEYPKPNVKMITTVKRLPDGTIVRNKRYETEELTPTTPSTRATSTTTNQTQPRRDSQQQPSKNYQADLSLHSKASQDMVDSSNSSRYVQDSHTDDVETKFSSIKKSSSKYSTESTSEVIQEFDDRHPNGVKPVTNDFSTHGFPSVRSNKPTQEYPGERSHTARPTQDFPSQAGPSRPSEAVVPHYYTDATDNITKDGSDVIIVSSEKKRNYKTSTNSERIVETEHVLRNDQPNQQIREKSGFPSVREPSGQQQKNYPSERQMQPHEHDFPLDKLHPGTRIIKPNHLAYGDGDVVVVSSQKSHTAKHSTNTERLVEHEIIRDDQPGGYPRIQPHTDSSPYNYTGTTPGEQMPRSEFPTTPSKPNADYSTQGFPSVKTPGHNAPGEREPYGDCTTETSKPSSNDYATPSVKSTSRPAAGLPSSHNRKSPSQDYSTQGFPSVRSPTKGTPTQGYPSNVDAGRPNGTAEPKGTPTTTKTQPRTPSPNKYKAPNTTVRETTERVIRKEKEVDSAHRAFAASLRSSSPIDHARRDSYTTDSHTRHTPRSSISSTKTFRRDMREGSHDSAPSETSRISTSTVTRNTPPRTVGGRNVVTKVVTTKTAPTAHDTPPRATKSPSPGKTFTTTNTTTRTLTSKDVPKATEKSPTKKPPPPPAPSSRSSTPSYNCRKSPPTSVMADDDDADMLNTTSPSLSPSSRTKTPKKTAPNDKPQDDWQTHPQPDCDERRTVNRETTFEKLETENAPSTQPRRPHYEQPNVEWIIVDDVDDYDDHNDTDNDSFASEVVDSKLNVKKTITKLITQEKPTSVAPQRRPKSTTTTTVTTKQLHTTPCKTQSKPSDRSPLKTKPNDSRTSQQLRPQKPLTDSKSPVRTPIKSQPKVVDNKQLPKGPKSTVPSYISPLRKPVPKSLSSEETTLRKTLKTTTQVVKDKTNKFIESEKLKRKPQSPERKSKPQTPAYKKPKGIQQQETEIFVTEITQNEPINSTPYETDDKPMQVTPSYRKPQGIDDESLHGYKGPLDTDNEPIKGRPSYKKPQTIDDKNRPGYRRLLDTDDEPHQGSPDFRNPQDIDDEPYFGVLGDGKSHGSHKEPKQGSPGFKKPQETGNEPNQGSPQQTFDEPKPGTSGFRKPLGTVAEPHKGSPGFRKPVSPGFRKLQNTFDERSPDYRKPQANDNELQQSSPHFTKPPGSNDEPHYSTPGYVKPQDVLSGYEKPKQIVEQQINITETSQNIYPQREAPKRPDTKPTQQNPDFYKPRNNDDEPNQGLPSYRKPQDPDYKPRYRQPHDTDEEPHKGSPGYRQPLYTDNEPGFRKPQDTEDEPNQGLPYYRNPQVTQHEIIITETTQTGFPDKETPQSPDTKPGRRTPGSRNPYDIDHELNQGKPRTTGHIKPSETEEEPTTLGFRKQPQTKPKYIKVGIEPKETDDDECFEETESIITNSKKTVAKHIQKFESNHLRNKSPQLQKETKSPTKELPQTHKKSPKIPSKETSPTRSQKKPDTQPRVRTPRSDKPFETDENETFIETNEFIVNSTQKLIVSEKQILEEEEPLYPGKKVQKHSPREVSSSTNQRKPGQKFTQEPTDKYPKTPKSSVSPTRAQRETEYPEDTSPSKKGLKPQNKPNERKPLDTDNDETVVETREFIINSTQKRVVNEKQILEFEDTKTTRKILPTQSLKKPEEPTGKRPESPGKHVSPTRLQKKPEQKSPLNSRNERAQSPNKHVSATRIQKKPNEKTPLDDGSYKTTLKPTRIVRKNLTKYLEDEESKPKNCKPLTGKSLDTDDDDTVIETSEYVTNSTQIRVVSEKHMSVFEEPIHHDKKPLKKTPDAKAPTREVAPTLKKPGQNPPEEPTEKRSQSPTKSVSPTRTQKSLKPHQTLPVDDQTFRKTLRTSETVTEKPTKKIDAKDYPVGKIHSNKDDKPITKPKADKPYSEQPSDTDEDETITENCEFVSNTMQKRMVTEQEILEFEKPRYPDNGTAKSTDINKYERISKSPIRGFSPTRRQRQPDEKQPEGRSIEPTGKRPQSPTKPIAPTSSENKPQSTDKRPKDFSPTRTQKKPNEKLPLEDTETFTTSYTSTKIVKEETTKDLDGPKVRTPHSVKPSNSDEDETIIETSEFVINATKKQVLSEKQIVEFEQPSYPDKKASTKEPEKDSPSSPKGVYPTRTQKSPSQMSPEEPVLKEPTDKRPHSPTKQGKPVDEDTTFKTSLRTTKTITEKSTKTVDEEYPEKITPYKKCDKPESKPKERKPSNTDEDKTITKTSERFISSKTCIMTEKPEFEEPESPTRGVSPTRAIKKPSQNLPEDADFKEPTDKRPKSPTLTQRKPGQEIPEKPTDNRPKSPKKPTTQEEIYEATLRTTKTQSEQTAAKVDKEEYPDRKTPSRTGDRPDTKPKERKPHSDKPANTDNDELFTSKHVISSRTHMVTKKEFQEPESPTQKKPGRKTEEPAQPREYTPKPYKPTKTDGDETLMETTEFVTKITQKPKYPGSQEPHKENSDKQSPVMKLQPTYRRPGFENIEDQETLTHTSEFVRNTAQKLITTEKQTIEIERELFHPDNKSATAPKDSPSSSTKELSPTRSTSPKPSTASVPTKTPRTPKDHKDSPIRSPSPKASKSGPKSATVNDETFRKTLRTTEICTDKTKPKDCKPGQLKTTDMDEEETTTDTEEFLIETCEKPYVIDRNITTEEDKQKLSTPLAEPKSQEPSDNKPDSGKPVNKSFTTTYVETIETIEGQTYPEDLEQFPVTNRIPDNQKPYTAPLEPWLPNQFPTDTTTVNEKFIETERVHKESPDGAFISKTTEPTSPTSPTYKKKGAGRRDTFEERCRQILGMDTYGNTPGSFKKQPISEVEEQKTEVKTNKDEDLNTTIVFQVKIEDCDEDDEPLSISSVKKTLHKQIYTNEPLREEPQEPKTARKPVNEPNNKPFKEESQYVGSKDKSTSHEDYTSVTKYPEDDGNKMVHTVTKTTTIHKKSPKTKVGDETEPDSSETETIEEQCLVVNKEIKKSEVKILKKSSPTTTPRAVSPTKSTSCTRSVSPDKPKATPKNGPPLKETPKRKLSKDSVVPKTNKTSAQNTNNDNTTTIKDRLRSSTRKTKSATKQDQVDGSESSPEHSPTRYTERRRSSNISVTTEIIIDHIDSDSAHKKENSPVPAAKKLQDSVFREIIDSTVLPEKLTRRLPVTERKESAPVHRVTNRDKDSKMSRSTSENLIRVQKPEPHSLSPKNTPKTTDHRRPNKCFATKSINLSATDRLVNSQDMENVIIDIQHAKSSREPSPDKIVPTPVPAHVDTGKPRYPDVVQEPEDDQPRRKPQVKNIPIFEEENNAYVGCHITEVNMERTHKTTYDSLDYEEQILNNPVVEAPPSLDYPSLEKPTYDESLLTVHEKVSKFQNIAEEVSKPKASEPFQREFDDNCKVPQNDECLLSVNEKLEKFVKTSIIKNNEEDDENAEFERNERIYTTVKLAPSAPQKSPELVRTISRHISRPNEPHSNDQQQSGYCNEDYPLTSSRTDDFVECLVGNNKKTTKEFEVSHQQHKLQQQSTIKTAEKYQQPKDHDDDDELIPHTATHTNIIEERRQKDILSRPSVFDSRNKKPTTTTKTPLQCNKSPVKDSEKLLPDIKSRTKPTSAATNTTLTETTTATTTTTNKPKQSPKCEDSDIDYELRCSDVETGVRNIISKQTKVYNNNNNNSSGSTKTNDLKKPTTSNKNKPEKHMPVRLTPAKNSNEHVLSADDDDDDDDDNDNEMIIKVHTKATDIYDIETQVVNGDLNKETTRKIPLTTPQKQQPITHSSNSSSPTDQPLKIKTKEHVVKLTESKPLKSNTITSNSIKTNETVEGADDIDETILVEPASKKKTTPHPSKTTKMSTTTTDSVAARRIIFESNNSSPSATPTKRTPLTSPLSNRRPSYMEHTKSSLEHTRRDSLEINKTNYARKPSHPEEEVPNFDRNSMVKFDVPQGKRTTTSRATSVTEDINVEDIFELEVLERLLETVQSYEIRRRIRAQIRLIKKNQKNELITSSTEIATKTVKITKAGSEEPDTVTRTITTRKTKPETKTTTTSQIVTKDGASHISSSKKEYIFEEAYMPTSRRSPKPNRHPYEVEKEPQHKPTRSQSPQAPVCRRNAEHERQYERSHNSPEHHRHTEEVREHASLTTKQQYYYKDERDQKHVQEIRHESSPSRKSPSHSVHSSPERRNASPESHKPLRAHERSRSPQTKAPKQSTRVTSSRSPDSKSSSVRKSSATTYEQQENLKTASRCKPQTKRITTTTTTTTTKSQPEDKTPVWADRKNILKTPKKASSSTQDSRAGYTKTVKSATSQKMTSSHKSSFVDDDCVTSSYGIGPTDENGLPLFGIRALKKKKPTVEPSETTEEVTGYVVEEKYYSDSKSKPKVERKEFIYSTNPEELQKLKEQVQVTTNRKALKDVEVKETRQTALIAKATPALRSSPEDDFLDSSTKYVRRGSVKEMSEKFIQREAFSAVTDKSNNYPKAGLILRTNSRKNSRDADNDNENYESYKTTRVQQHTSTVLADSDDCEHEYEVEEVGSRHSGRFITESESECDSIKTQREFKKVTSSSSSSMATRSFLNTQGDEKVITNVSECLDRMRNADNVVEEGDTAEDQEARALLNKFLGASIIMKGVESSLPATSNRQSKTITTTTTSSNLSDDNDGDNNAKHEVKTTRITKTIKSGSSSTPVTHTTCAIEEIWDEEILKELLEQARTYEERRKIRSRLRELMADREETKHSPIGKEPTPTAANVAAEEESSASEYEEIIEEVTDYSEAESDVDNKKEIDKVVDEAEKSQKHQAEKTFEAVAVVAKTEETSETSNTAKSEQETLAEQAEETTTASETVTETETVEEVVEETSSSKDGDTTDSSEKGESLKSMVVHDKQKMPQEGYSSHSNHSTNIQKLKTAQTNSNSQANSSMHAPYSNKNNINNKTQKRTSTASTASQNPIVTVHTAGRADSTSISNKTNNKNNSSRQTHSNTSNLDINCKDNVNNVSSSSSLGGSCVVAVGSSVSPRQVDRLGVPQKEDSGTESGEDLRLIAAGLRDQLQIQSDSNIIEDVTGALSRLENSLKEGKDISVDSEKRKALLALVARLRAGLTSPEKLAEIAAAMSELGGNEGLYDETSSPEADAHRSNRSRFAKRRNRVNRHTVGVSREELADARRYMEDMLIISNISQSTTPEANNSPPQWYPLEKNVSSAAILTQSSTPVLQRPKQFVATEGGANMTYNDRLTVNNAKRRPLSGEYSVTFENPAEGPKESSPTVKQTTPPEDGSKFSRFTNKKHLMKRANTIDLAKTHKYNSEFDTDSDTEAKGPHVGLKRAVQVSVKKRVQNVVPPFEPKTENDRKFLAFINKQSDKPGLGWTSSRSVSNWTNKFGSIKSTFEGGLASKPPQAPYHATSSVKPQQSSKLFSLPMNNNSAAPYTRNQQIALRLQQEAERQAEERKKKLEREHLEFERRERDKLERLRQQRERQERERLEREHFERQRREQDQLAAAQHAAILREQEQFAAANMSVAKKPIPINEFKHAPQSVFRPIDNVDSPFKPIYKPIAQLPRNSSNWQSLNNAASPRRQGNSLTTTSPSQYSNTKPDSSFITSPPPSARSPIALPWASKPTVDSSAFKSKANRFEERSKYENVNSAGSSIQRHNSLNSSNGASQQHSQDFRKRPSLPNTCDPYSVGQMPQPHQDPLAHLPPPQNISFTYSKLTPKTTYQSYPCLPSAVVNNSRDNEYQRSREDSLTDPQAMPLVLTSSNPLYCPTTPPQLQQNQPQQFRLPRQFDLVSPVDSTPTSPSIYNMPQTDCTDDDLDSDINLLEYHAVSRVMGKPQSQTAVTVGRRTGHVSDDELFGKNSRAAKNLLSTMKSIGNPNGMAKPKAPVTKRTAEITSPKKCLSPDGRSYQAPIVEPLFPEINKFEANRQPTYNDEIKKPTIASTYPQPAPRKKLGIYHSMENLKSQNSSNFTNPTTQQPTTQPYVTEAQTSYVVTYPLEDTTDDEDFSQLGKTTRPPKSLELQRQRNVSENSTASSTTASMICSQNLPSPNTSWTSNPIVVDESSNYPNIPTPYQIPGNPTDPTYQALSCQVVTSYPNYDLPASSEYQKTAVQYEVHSQRSMPAQQQMTAQYETPSQRSMPAQYEPPMASMRTQQQMAAPYESPSQRSMPAQQPTIATQLSTNQENSMPTTKSSYEAKSQRQLQQLQSTTNQKKPSPTSSTFVAQAQPPAQQQVPQTLQKPPVTQKPTDYPKQSLKTTTTTKSAATTTTTQEKRNLAILRKTVSEDHHSVQVDQPVVNPQHSSISQEMLTRLDQQRERISNDIRRKSLGNALDYQLEKQARFETQHSKEYKSSAPENTPDIVKSSLPKDETQPILKKFGPPQRHHYMPNSYQSPVANTTSTSVKSTSTHSTQIKAKDVHSSFSTHTVVHTAQQIFNNTRPTVMETPATPQPDDDYIPRNIVFNNVHAFTSMNRQQELESVTLAQEQHQANIRPNKLSKSDSWKQIMMLQNQHVPAHATKFNQSPTNELRRTKSGHTLALPKMYEAAITKTQISEKQKTVAAYFSGQKSPTQQESMMEQQTTNKRSVINRIKTSEKVSAASRKSLGSNLPITAGTLQRSATMPHIADLNLLDESNVEDAFEQLIMEQKQQKSSTSTTEKTETKDKDGAVVTTTTKVTTRTVTGSAAKPASPFAKFKQLDKQNSQQSTKSPTTSTTAGGGSTASPSSGNQPIFRFTDPALNAKAATVKEQLLQWCQTKTQEYENIEITNFSTSWNNGLAFCALIHHFLPDAFDYSQLTPKNRRKNFELAFTVADEKAGIAPLLDVEDMVVMQRPDWKCVFVYVQSIYRRFRNCQ